LATVVAVWDEVNVPQTPLVLAQVTDQFTPAVSVVVAVIGVWLLTARGPVNALKLIVMVGGGVVVV
jgi:hypothetical protein